MIKVALIINDTLQCEGVRAILDEYFQPIEIEIVSTDTLNDDYNLYIMDSDTFVAQQEFIAPRRQRVLTITTGAVQNSSTTQTICCKWSMEQIVDTINNVISQLQTVENHVGEELSAREIQVLQLVVNGTINRDIATQLNISLNTVLTHRKNITTKLGIKTVSGLTLYALMHGYIQG